MFKRTNSIERELHNANKRLKAISAALGPKHMGGDWDEFNKASEDVLRLEREFAKLKGEPYAISCDFPVKWDIGAPLPYLLCNDYRTFLTFYISEPDSNWNGTYVNEVDPGSPDPASLCLEPIWLC